MLLSERRRKRAAFPLQNLLLDALFPPRCCACTEWSRAAFCGFCRPRLRRVASPLCGCCGAPFDPLAFPAPQCAACRAKAPPFHAARSAFLFDGPMRDALHRFKYAQKNALALRLAPFLAEVVAQDAVLSAFAPHFLVAVPLHASRLKKRGFNQSFLLARELGQEIGVSAVPFLIRIRATPPQVDLNRPQRAQNVKGAFAVAKTPHHETQLQGARILLIDDVFTTGATLGECARTLRRAGASQVCALTLARQL